MITLKIFLSPVLWVCLTLLLASFTPPPSCQNIQPSNFFVCSVFFMQERLWIKITVFCSALLSWCALILRSVSGRRGSNLWYRLDLAATQKELWLDEGRAAWQRTLFQDEFGLSWLYNSRGIQSLVKIICKKKKWFKYDIENKIIDNAGGKNTTFPCLISQS